MEITTVNSIFFEAISKASKITTKNPQIPVLEYVLLEIIDETTLRVTANNLDIFYIQDVFIKSSKETFKKQSICVSGNLILSYLGLFNKESEVKIYISEKNIILEINNQKSTINGVSSADYPKNSEILAKNTENEGFIKISSDVLIQGIQAVSFSAAITSIKPELSCVLMSVTSDVVTFAATDGFRLAEKRFLLSKMSDLQVDIKTSNLEDFRQVLVPSKIFQDVLKVIPLEVELQIFIKKGSLYIHLPEGVLIVRMISGAYPNYQAIIPKNFVTHVEVSTFDILHGLKASNLFSDEFNYVKLDIQENSLVLNSKNAKIGESLFKKEIKKTGEDISQSYNHRYLSDFIGKIKDDYITIDISGKATPTIIKVKNDDSYTYLVMPMNK